MRQTMPQLTEAQSKGLALWTFGTITAKSGRRNAGIAALNFSRADSPPSGSDSESGSATAPTAPRPRPTG